MPSVPGSAASSGSPNSCHLQVSRGLKLNCRSLRRSFNNFERGWTHAMQKDDSCPELLKARAARALAYCRSGSTNPARWPPCGDVFLSSSESAGNGNSSSDDAWSSSSSSSSSMSDARGGNTSLGCCDAIFDSVFKMKSIIIMWLFALLVPKWPHQDRLQLA